MNKILKNEFKKMITKHGTRFVIGRVSEACCVSRATVYNWFQDGPRDNHQTYVLGIALGLSEKDALKIAEEK